MVGKVDKNELLGLLDKLIRPKLYKLTEKEGDQVLIDFCASCPDPVMARWLVVECVDPMTNEQLVDRALAMPSRPMADVPISVVPVDHPLRKTP